jgi:aryl-alcohol dehydrogenase-like predicted oxidoreductase
MPGELRLDGSSPSFGMLKRPQIILGTVQLGLPYGRRKWEDVLDLPTAYRILDAAWESGIDTFDTAEAYGLAPGRLAGWLQSRGILARCHIVTKVPASDSTDERKITAAHARFAGAASITLYSHGLLPPGQFSIFESIARTLGAQAGQSVYTAAEVHGVCRTNARRVQAPVNLYDLRQLAAARSCGIHLDARSLFLQGVLLETPAAAEQRVRGIGLLVRCIHDAASEVGITPSVALLSSVLRQLRPDDRVVIGFDSEMQLIEVLTANSPSDEVVEQFLRLTAEAREQAISSPDLLDPRTWN